VTTWQMRTQKTYTATSKVATVQDGAGDTTIYGYDGMDRELMVTDPVGRRVASVFDLAGQVTCVFRGWGSATVMPSATDCANWSAAGYAGVGPVRYARYTYSGNGKPVTALDANGNLSTTVYDGFDRISQQQYPMPTLGSGASDPSDYELFTYDANGNRLSERRRDGQVIAFSYDNLNRLTVKQLPGATSGWVYYGYDGAGRATYAHFASAAGAGIDFGYDSAKRVISEATFGHALQFLYDLSGNRIRLTWPDGNYVVHDFDALNRDYQLRENGATTGVGVLAVYGYDAFSRKTSVTRGNGTTASYSFDTASRLTSLGQNNAGTAQDVTFGFGYTLASQLQSRTSSNALFDWLPSASSQSYSPDGLDRYAAVSGATYAYDGRGNLTSDSIRTMAYDAENHLLSVTGGTAPLTLSYDPLGRLYQTSASAVTQFVYEGSRLTAEYDGSGNLLRRYVHGPGTDNPEVWYEGAGLTVRNWLEADERGTVIATSDATGAATPYTYGPYGEPSTWSGSRFRYTGQIALPEGKLYHYKARVYDPGIGRFLQTDPIGTKDDSNLYSYVEDDPIDGIDPWGLDVYKINRDLQIVGESARPRWDPLTHTFIAVTNPDGMVLHTYSWGNEANLRGWNMDQPLDLGAARQALDKTEAEWVGDSSLNGDVKTAFSILNRKENEHENGLISNNCKTEASRLVDVAKSVHAMESQTSAAKGYASVKVNSNGTATGTYTPIGTRIPKTITCDSKGKCTSN